MAKISYDTILDALKAIAAKLNATLPEKKYSNQKDAIAGALDAISDADIGGGGGGGAFIANDIYDETIENNRLDKTAEQIVAAIDAGKILYVKRDSSYDDPEYGYTDYTCGPLTLYQYHNSTGTKEEQRTSWQFTFGSYVYTASSLADYPTMTD